MVEAIGKLWHDKDTDKYFLQVPKESKGQREVQVFYHISYCPEDNRSFADTYIIPGISIEAVAGRIERFLEDLGGHGPNLTDWVEIDLKDLQSGSL